MSKPYYQDKFVTIYHGDCREILPQLDVKVDATVTDMPYGNDTDYGTYQDTQDNLVNLIKTALPFVLEISTVSGITTGIGNMYKYPIPDWVFAWYIGMNGVHSTPYGFNCWQPILVYGKDPYLSKGMGRHSDVILQDMDKKPINYRIKHPCPKSIGSWTRLVKRLSPLNEQVILDPFLGSGTTCYCAKKLNRYSIGIEVEEKYCEIAAKRCSQEVMELNI